jgi:hypothetical protein
VIVVLFVVPHLDEELLELGHAIDGCHPGIELFIVPEGVACLRGEVLEREAEGSKLSELGQF